MKVSIKQLLFYFLYCTFGKSLPASRVPVIGRLCKGIRGFFASRALCSCGKNVNVERNASFSPRCEIGDNSGIGENAKLRGRVIIGNNVMMAPDVVVYTSNHRFSRTDIPIGQQGNEDELPVYIGSDVWIGHGCIILPGKRIGDGCVIEQAQLYVMICQILQLVGEIPLEF